MADPLRTFGADAVAAYMAHVEREGTPEERETVQRFRDAMQALRDWGDDGQAVQLA